MGAQGGADATRPARPHGGHHPDPSTPIDESLQALDDVVRAGKARYVGCSNYFAYQVARALGRSELLGLARLDCVQPRYNLLFRQVERELFPLCAEEGLGVIAYNPIAGVDKGLDAGLKAQLDELTREYRWGDDIR